MARAARMSVERGMPSGRQSIFVIDPHLVGNIAQRNRGTNPVPARGADQLLWTLEQGSLLRAAGQYQASDEVFDFADAVIETYDRLPEVSITAEGAATLTNLAALPYRGTGYDRIMVSTYRALNAMKLGDMENARVELNRAQVRQQEGPLGGDIITTEQFGDFELALEWKVSPGGNSGIMYRVTEAYDESYKSGPEMQVLDDSAHADGQDRLTSAGSNYALNAAPAGVVKRAGEWNAVRILVKGNHVEHWLNGQKVVEYELMSPDWETRVKQSKFAEWPGYGRAPRGHIALQDHGDRVAYRNIKIREPR